MPCLPALFNAERTSCHDLPRNCRSGRSTRVSSATCTRCQPSARVASAVSSVAENRHGTQPLRSHIVAYSRTRVGPFGGGADRVSQPDRDARVPLVGHEGVAVGGAEPGVLGPGRHPGQRAAAVLLQHLRGGLPVDGRGRGPASHPPSRRHPEGRAADDEHDQQGRPQQLVGGEARDAVANVDNDVIADDGRRGCRAPRSPHPRRRWRPRRRRRPTTRAACPLRSPRISRATTSSVMPRPMRSSWSPSVGPSGPSSGTK